MRLPLRHLLSVLILAPGVACHGDCLAGPATYGLGVSLVDATSGARITTSAMVVARDGAYADTADTPEPWGTPEPRYLLAFSRSGVYTVSVLADGYRQWERRNVRVRESDACVTQMTSLTARLSR